MPSFVIGSAQRRASDFRASPCSACSVRQYTVCAALAPEELHRLDGIVSKLTAEPRQTVFSEGDDADFVYNVTAGSAKVYKLLPDGRRQVTGFLFPGDFLGLAFNGQYAYSAEAIDKIQLCRFPRRKLEALFEEFPKMEKRLLGLASDELAAAQDQMLLLGRKSAKEKIASFLLRLSLRQIHRTEAQNPVHLPMSRADIADYLGLTTETVSRTLTQLKRQGLIALCEGGLIEFRNPNGLGELAEGS
jgi:CRP/FNR family transcriptional regulator